MPYDNMTRAPRSSLAAWGPLPTYVVAPFTPINLRAADSASNDGLVLPLRNRLAILHQCRLEYKVSPSISCCVITVNVPGCRTCNGQNEPIPYYTESRPFSFSLHPLSLAKKRARVVA